MISILKNIATHPRLWLLIGSLFFSVIKMAAQPHPPRPISVYANPTEGIKFGAFFQGIIGGSVIVFADGTRSTTGDIIQAGLGYPYAPAIFEVEADKGTRITILNGPDVTLYGSNGGSISLHLGPSNFGSSFVSNVDPPSRTQVFVGATLTVGTPLANPIGNYSGTFSITFIQE